MEQKRMSTENDQLIHWQKEAIAFLALASIKGVGYWTMRSIYQQRGSFYELIKTGSQEDFQRLTSVKFVREQSYDWEHYKADLWSDGVESWKWLGSEGVGLIFHAQPEFPPALATIPDLPYWLFVQGDLLNLHTKAVAIVGTRRPTSDGIFLAKYVVAALAGHAWPTVSGLALGIDQVVHEESMRFGIPTIAVLGTGINQNYPRGSAAIRAEILSRGGTIISEYLPDQSYSADNFVWRNRLQAGLCDTLVPVEWNIKSGTAHTVEFAHRYGRKIANVFLPHSFEKRPEIKFAEEAYGAVACEAPQMTSLLLQFIDEDQVSSTDTQVQLDLLGAS
jgi:DNA processing protein